MSLTSLIRSSDSHTKDFFVKHFPYVTEAAKLINQGLDGIKLLDCLPKNSPGHVYGWVGTAFDYRARYYLKVTPYRKLMAYNGGRIFETNDSFGRKLDDWVRKIRKPRKKLSASQVRNLCLLTLLLAKLEVLGRAYMAESPEVVLGAEHYPIVKEAIAQPTIAKTLKIIAAKYDPVVVKDLMTLSRAFHKNIDGWKIRHSVLNPVFYGSPDVGGADADMILGSVLVEIKCKKRAIGRNDLFQLIGYKLLDYHNWYGIDCLGIYFGRHGVLQYWPLRKLLKGLGCPIASVVELRKKFRRAVDKDMRFINGYF